MYFFVSSVIVHAMDVNGHLDILQNIFFGFPQKKASFTDMKQHEGEKKCQFEFLGELSI